MSGPPDLVHEQLVAHYGIDVADPRASRPQVRFCRRGEGALRRAIGRASRRGRPRLAYVDTHFPWRRSGFRHDEALALHELRPDTLFFSLWPLRDPFPAPVHPLAEFPRRATTAGVTDVYAVFLDCVSGLVGEARGDGGPPHPMTAPDLSSALRGMRVHAGLYPGGGLVNSPESLDKAQRTCRRVATAFTWVPEVAGFEHVVTVPPAIYNRAWYEPVERDWEARPLRVLFAADASPRKGLEELLAAIDLLDERFAFHIVGPHAERAAQSPARANVTFEGWLEPEGLRARFHEAHVLLSPVRPERAGDGVMIDGFPTTTAASAAGTGALLVTGNPRSDHTVLTPGETHVELDEITPAALAAALDAVERDRARARAIAARGCEVVRARLDVRGSMRERLLMLGLLDGRAPEGAR